MKFKTTKKVIMANYGKVIKVGYCNLQYLLNYESPIAYTSGINGWNADIYDFGGVAICTGYNPFGNICPNWELLEKYEQEAEKICHDYSYEERRNSLRELQKKFIDEVCE